MWEFLLVAAIVIVVFGFSIRRQLRFFLGARREVAGRISEVEPFLEQDDNGSRWVTRCKVEYEVDGKLYQRRTMRRVQPALGEAVILTYPESRPDEAVEGHQQAAAKQQIFALVASLLALLFLFLFRAYQASLLPE
ncbi:hypothetical protein OGR47_15995 [Methylocystis sp. MJC1]|jgi:hypothetical protein|uniref:DUF3592 domain-containing protein n=1 Tax=Methylocystis sp. MJC1 TaxID=2654282 RepID=UPI0013ECDB54|nr:DUF3592 domain-containing protein [Methylocystis sp. MJC1]KAF2989145.1 hypothetical protein MJC1_03809 [Methylocystis sp. MJC1]MBU6528459.1 hypothetical protein [Methylocystis sp. MJC1]UZX11359.1 hypothetical protein OGR47_15995 [Methylocystis sp. MJC1]